ncbi:YqaJ viral recombinase family nuclease [Paraburkholderia adhaesiva]|uniref:YqaJ viral recombinase family nuclease n=1 Tax=Paraburkholderia adhaesiva TaxID=2883244 RepID=UPI001F3B73C0|nr:YqaJ viral recombinase family protein [Paraburkholderia adhaesiva]
MSDATNADAQAVDRATFVGGSDVAAILGVSPWRTPLDIWREKTRRTPRVEITEAQQKRFDRGHRLEPFVVDMLIDRLKDEGHTVELLCRNARYVDQQYPFMQCEIDFELMLDGTHTTGDAKTVHPFAAKQWGQEQTDEVPTYYGLQFMHGLGITGRSRCIVAALVGMDDLLVYWVERDEETIAAIRGRVSQFWNECVLADVEPDPIDFDDCYAMYQQSNGGRIEATSNIRDAVFELADVKHKLKILTDREDDLKYCIAEYMRPNAYLTAGGHDLATWKNQPFLWLDEKAFAKDFPELYARYRRTKQIRVLRLKIRS